MIKTLKLKILLILICFFISCKEDKKSRYGFESKNYKENHIDFIHGTLLLPNEYMQLSEEEFLFYSEKEDLSKTIAVSMIDFSEASKINFTAFTRENDLNDLVLLYSGEYINFSKRIANQYLGMLEVSLRENWGSLGIQYSRMEQKMTQTERSKYIKIKYRLKADLTELFFTQYIVTSNLSTFGILVINTTGVDREELVKRILFKV